MSSGILPNLDIFSCEFILKCAWNEIILHLQRFTTILKHSFTRFWRYDWPPRLVAACGPPESEPNTRREDCWRPGNRTTLAAAASGLGCNTQRHPSTLSWAIIMLPCLVIMRYNHIKSLLGNKIASDITFLFLWIWILSWKYWWS